MAGYSTENNVHWLFLLLGIMFADWVYDWEYCSLAVPRAGSNV